MSSEGEQLVKFLCVDVKPGETPEKLKTKVLRLIRHAEKKTTPASSIIHPLQTWNGELHTLPDLKAKEISKVVANSSCLVFLRNDGRVCHLGVNSWEETSDNKPFSSVDALRQSRHLGSNIEILGDEEYARQLQAEFSSGSSSIAAGREHDWRRNRSRYSPPSLSLGLGGILSSATVEENLQVPPILHIRGNSMPYSLLEENSLNSEWRSAISGLNSGLGASSFSDGVTGLSSRMPGKKGSAKGEGFKLRVWPEMKSLEWLVMKQNPDSSSPDSSSFVSIAAMHSEILLVSSSERCLYSWACGSQAPPKSHPLTKDLGLEGERITLLEASDVRATVVTESGKIATFYDELLRATPDGSPPSLVESLTHQAQVFPELEGEKVVHLSVSSFLTCAITQSGKVYWWGLCPPTKAGSSDHPTPLHHPPTSHSGHTPMSSGTIIDGSLVRLKNGPPCGPNAIVFNESGPSPRVGRTMNIIEHSGLDPKTSILVKVYKDVKFSALQGANRTKNPGPLRDINSQVHYKGLEVWSLSDVVFLDDAPAILGRVVTVDQLQAIVDISYASSESGTMKSTSGAQSTLKVFKLSEVELCMDSVSPNRSSSASVSANKEEGFESYGVEERASIVEGSSKIDCPLTAGGGGSSGEGETRDGGTKVIVSRHIAGLVQHRPVCLLTPSLPVHPTITSAPPPSSLNMPHPPSESSPTLPSCIRGFYPLAVQMTDNGPAMLVKRVSDGAAFLTCSGHPGFPSFLSSSFVSLNPRDLKPGKCTIEEESVSATDGGFDREVWSNQVEELSDDEAKMTGVRTDIEVAEDLESNKELRSAIGGDDDEGSSRSDKVSQRSKSKHVSVGVSHPCFLQLHKSKAVLLQDRNGLICPLWEGLRLKPLLSLAGQRGKREPMQPYKCIVSRTHLIKKDTSVLIVVLVPQPQHFMPSILSGDAAKVDYILTKLANPSDQSDEKKGTTPSLSSGAGTSHDTSNMPPVRGADTSSPSHSLPPPAKRVRIAELVPKSTIFFKESSSHSTPPTIAEVPELKLMSLSKQDAGKIDFDVELSVLSETCTSGGGGAGDEVGVEEKAWLNPEILKEVTVDNSNVLHVCGQLDAISDTKTKGGISVKSKHALSSLSESSFRVRGDMVKSFEELRMEHLQENSHDSPRTLESVEGCGLSLRWLWILERILGCQHVRNTVMNLLCSRNREGYTPFLSAIHHQNYSAALKILQFVESATPTSSSIFQRAILDPSPQGLSALHLLLASLTPNFDTKSMVLYVHNLQLSTAQQLLRLFQVRYPSAYKAEIIKKGSSPEGVDRSSGGSSEGSGSEDNDGDYMDTMNSHNSLPGRFRIGRSYRRMARRRIRQNHDLLPSSMRNGVVYFSDVMELRAAAREMQGFRMSVFRNTGFGTTYTSYLNVSLEEPSESGGEGDNFSSYLGDRGDPISSALNTGSIYEIMGGVVGGTARTSKKKNPPHKLSSTDMARKLLHSLLSHHSLVTSLDSAGETPLASAIHNPCCIERLLPLNPAINKRGGANSDPLNATATNTTSQGKPMEGVIQDQTRCPLITSLSDYTISSENSNKSLDGPSSRKSLDFGTGIGSHSSNIMPYVSLGLDQGSNDSLSLSTTGLLVPTEPLAQEMDCAPSPTQSIKSLESLSKHLELLLPRGVSRESSQDDQKAGQGVEGGESGFQNVDMLKRHVQTAMELEQKVLERVNLAKQLNSSQPIESSSQSCCSLSLTADSIDSLNIPSMSTDSLGKGSSTLKTPESDFGTGIAVLKEPLLFGKGATSAGGGNIAVENMEVLTSTKDTISSMDTTRALFSNWSSIVTTVLGFDRSSSSSSSSSLSSSSSTSSTLPPQISSVHLLDSFTTDLVLNCSEEMIDYFINKIIEKLNSAVNVFQEDPSRKSNLSLLLHDIDYSDWATISKFFDLGEEGVAVLVGRRFLGSLVRVLSLEHSRVKNRFLEMQQARQAAQNEGQDTSQNPSDSLSATPRRRGDNQAANSSHLSRKTAITTTLIGIISKFSWLAVHALSQAAEACASPVRLGVSKPLGASSVVAEYQTNGRGYVGSNYATLTSSSGRQSPGVGQIQTMTRQLHVRAAKLSGSLLAKTNSCLPLDGLFLRPNQLDGETDLTSSTRSTVAPALNTSLQDDSFDEELEQNKDEESNTIGSTHASSSPIPLPPIHASSSSLPFPIDPTSPPYTTSIHNNEVFLDLDSVSSSDEDYNIDYMEWRVGTGHGGGTAEEDSLDTIYPFAWALDGRMIGESGGRVTGRADSPNSVTVPISFNSTHDPPIPLANIPSIRFGAGFLARTFARFVKDLADISHKIFHQQLSEPCLTLPLAVQQQLVANSVHTLELTWRWAVCVLDMAEVQLAQGQHFDVQRHVISLRGRSNQTTSSSRPTSARASRSYVGSTPGEYVASLLRSQAHEDRDCLPVLDLYGYEHIVYVLDGLLYSIDHWPKPLISAIQSDSSTKNNTTSLLTGDEVETNAQNISKKRKLEPNEDTDTPPSSKSNSKFFKRTESVTISSEKSSNTQMSNDQFFGVEGGASLVLESPELVGPPNQWGKEVESFSRPLTEEYPLANHPHLLKPFARKEVLFGGSGTSRESSMHAVGGVERKEEKRGRKRKHISNKDESSSLTMMWSPEHVQQRWHLAISVFAHIFLAEGPGNERSNFLNARAGFASRMARFRHQVSQLYDASHLARDWAGTISSTFSIRVRRDRLMADSLNVLQQMSNFHFSNVRVKFDGEDGSGPGVNRGFFASLSNELKSSDLGKSPLNRLGLFFHEPGKQPEQSGLFAPHPFMPHLVGSPSRQSAIKAQRRDAFVAIGRFFGLCLWFHYTIPFMVCRHVAKVLLGRPLAWHDLAFYNADLYEGLRQMMLDAEQGKKDDKEFMATYCCYFEAPLPGKFLEPVLVELIPGGSNIPVSASRVQEYVRLYSIFMMVGCIQDELDAMKEGLNDIILSDLLSGLTAEDFQLLLSGGSADITLPRLKSIIRFNHTHGSSRTVCDRFEKMFWRIVSHMSNTQRQQLLYFATGSAALPASVDSSNRMPSVAITLDVISSRNVDSLPVASTCSQRMCIPLYPSYHILKKKLLQAIQCQAYGHGFLFSLLYIKQCIIIYSIINISVHNGYILHMNEFTQLFLTGSTLAIIHPVIQLYMMGFNYLFLEWTRL